MKESNERIRLLSLEYAKLYELPAHTDFLDITSTLLIHPRVSEGHKQHLKDTQRRTILFSYPSDGLKIKGLISFLPNTHENPTLVLLRGGNKLFGVLNPGSDLVCFNHYTVIATTYRGGVSEGKDEYGGDDVNDVKNLIDYIPTLAKNLKITLSVRKMFLLGASRGGMQLFLTLERFPELQALFAKVVTLSGLFDLRETIAKRPDMKQMFIDEFGFVEGENEDEWIQKRDPLSGVDKIDARLPILVIQGTEDKRVTLNDGYKMVKALQALGKQVTYQEIAGADHCLSNRSDRIQIISQWLEEL